MIESAHNSFLTFFHTQLNSEQKQAVQHTHGSLLIVAGAGSGKTRVITARMVYLMLQHYVAPEHIVALTFTNKAAREMKERMSRFLGSNAKPFIGTFHAYCLYLLRSYPHISQYHTYTILDGEDQLQLLNGLIKQHKVEKKISAKQLSYQISQIKNNFMHDPIHDYIVKTLYHAYHEAKKQSKLLDFDDLLLVIHQLVSSHPDFKQHLQQTVRHILVDEYQDTNIVQHELLKLLATDDQKNLVIDSVCAVGDEDQSIYSWRGATVANIMQFQHDFVGTSVIKIEQNYRSVQPILAIANHIIQNNTYRNEKKLWSDKPAHGRACIMQYASGYHESDGITYFLQTIQKLHPTFSCAILYRAHYQSRVIEEALLRHALSYEIIGGIQFYERKEIKDILAYLKLLVNPYDRVSLLRIINTPLRGLGQKFEEQLQEVWHQQPLWSYDDVLYHMLTTHMVQGKKAEALRKFKILLSTMPSTDNPAAIIQKIITDTEYVVYLQTTYDSQEAQTKIENLKEFIRAAQYASSQGVTSLTQFLQDIALMQEKLSAQIEDAPHVQLMTIHAAKGLEFDVVTIIGLEEGMFPSTHAVNELHTLEEERRLLYVAITRSREWLLLSHAQYRFSYGTTTEQTPSRFLQEVPAAYTATYNASTWNSFDCKQFFHTWLTSAAKVTSSKPTLAPTQPTYDTPVQMTPALRVHQKVRHATFGTGTITALEQKSSDVYYAQVRFATGVKKIRTDFLKALS